MRNLKYLLLSVGILFISCNKDNNNTNNCQFSGTWIGTYNGGESGDISGIISTDCTISGTATPDSGNTTYYGIGSVENDGSNFSVTIGTVSTVAVFSGTLNGNTGTGGWINESEGLSCNWTIFKQ